MELVLGHIPKGLPEALGRAADAWSDTADGLEALADRLEAARARLAQAVEGETGDAIQKQYRQLIADTQAQIEYSNAMARRLYDFRNAVEYQLYTIFGIAGVILAQVIASMVLPPPGSIASAIVKRAEGEATMAVSQRGFLMAMLVRVARFELDYPLVALATKGMFFGAVIGGGVPYVAQRVQIEQGHLQKVDWEKVRLGVAAGAVGGIVGGVAGGAVAPAATRVGGRVLGTVAAGGVGGVAGGAAGAVTVWALTNGEVRAKDLATMTWLGFTSGLVSSAGAAVRAARAAAYTGQVPGRVASPDVGQVPRRVASPDAGQVPGRVASPDVGQPPDSASPQLAITEPGVGQPPRTQAASPELISQVEPPRARTHERLSGDGSDDRPGDLTPEKMAEVEMMLEIEGIYRDLGPDLDALIARNDPGNAPGQDLGGGTGATPRTTGPHPGSPGSPHLPSSPGASSGGGDPFIAINQTQHMLRLQDPSGAVGTMDRPDASFGQPQIDVGGAQVRPQLGTDTVVDASSTPLDTPGHTAGMNDGSGEYVLHIGPDGDMQLVQIGTDAPQEPMAVRPTADTGAPPTSDQPAVVDLDADFAHFEAQFAQSPEQVGADNQPAPQATDTTPQVSPPVDTNLPPTPPKQAPDSTPQSPPRPAAESNNPVQQATPPRPAPDPTNTTTRLGTDTNNPAAQADPPNPDATPPASTTHPDANANNPVAQPHPPSASDTPPTSHAGNETNGPAVQTGPPERPLDTATSGSVSSAAQALPSAAAASGAAAAYTATSAPQHPTPDAVHAPSRQSVPNTTPQSASTPGANSPAAQTHPIQTPSTGAPTANPAEHAQTTTTAQAQPHAATTSRPGADNDEPSADPEEFTDPREHNVQKDPREHSIQKDPREHSIQQDPRDHNVQKKPAGDYITIPGVSYPLEDEPPANAIPVVPHLPATTPLPDDSVGLARSSQDPDDHTANTLDPASPRPPDVTNPLSDRHLAAPPTHLDADSGKPGPAPVLPGRYATEPDPETPGAPHKPTAPQQHPDSLEYNPDQSGVPIVAGPPPRQLTPPQPPVQRKRLIPQAQASMGDGEPKPRKRKPPAEPGKAKPMVPEAKASVGDESDRRKRRKQQPPPQDASNVPAKTPSGRANTQNSDDSAPRQRTEASRDHKVVRRPTPGTTDARYQSVIAPAVTPVGGRALGTVAAGGVGGVSGGATGGLTPWALTAATPERTSVTSQANPRQATPEPVSGDGHERKPDVTTEMMAAAEVMIDELFGDIVDKSPELRADVTAFESGPGDEPGQSPDQGGGTTPYPRTPGPQPGSPLSSPGRATGWPAWDMSQLARSSVAIAAPLEGAWGGQMSPTNQVEPGGVQVLPAQTGTDVITDAPIAQPDAGALSTEILVAKDGSSPYMVQISLDGVRLVEAGNERPLIDLDAEFARLETELAQTPEQADTDNPPASANPPQQGVTPPAASSRLTVDANRPGTPAVAPKPGLEATRSASTHPVTDANNAAAPADPARSILDATAPAPRSEAANPAPQTSPPRQPPATTAQATSGSMPDANISAAQTHPLSPTAYTAPALSGQTPDADSPAAHSNPPTPPPSTGPLTTDPTETPPTQPQAQPFAAIGLGTDDDEPTAEPRFPPPGTIVPDPPRTIVPDPREHNVWQNPAERAEHWKRPPGDYVTIPGVSYPLEDEPPANAIPVIPRVPSATPTRLPADSPAFTPTSEDPDGNRANLPGSAQPRPPEVPEPLPGRHPAAPATHLDANPERPDPTPVLPSRYALEPDPETPGAPHKPTAPQQHPDSLEYNPDQSGVPIVAGPPPRQLARPKPPVQRNRLIPRAQASMGDGPEPPKRKKQPPPTPLPEPPRKATTPPPDNPESAGSGRTSRQSPERRSQSGSAPQLSGLSDRAPLVVDRNPPARRNPQVTRELVERARRSVHETLANWPVEGYRDRAETIVQELVRRALALSDPNRPDLRDPEVSVQVLGEPGSRRALVKVTDHNNRDLPAKPQGAAFGWRAAKLIEQATNTWGFELPQGQGTTVWFELPEGAERDPSQAMPEPAVNLTFPPGAVAPGASQARRTVKDFLTQIGVPEGQLDDVVTLVSELVGNVDRYAPEGHAQVRVWVDGNQLRVAIGDESRGLPKRQKESDFSGFDLDTADFDMEAFDLGALEAGTHGRGIGLMEELSTVWGVTLSPAGKDIWFEVLIPSTTQPETGATTPTAPEVDPRGGRQAEPNDSAQDSPSRGLSEREIEVLARIAEGKSNAEIGTDLGISESTVTNHLTNIRRKLGTGDRTAMAVAALRAGLLPNEAPTTPDTPTPTLSKREIEVLALVAEGKSSPEIGTELGLSKRTVDSHLLRMGKKFGTGDRTAMTIAALRAGLLPSENPTTTDTPTPTLSEREIEVLALVDEGKSNAEIGTHLGISGQTVVVHLRNIRLKLGTGDRATIVVRAQDAQNLAGEPATPPVPLPADFDPAEQQPPSDATLTDLEVRVLGLVAEGNTNSAIATSLDTSEKTVGAHLTRIAEKLGTGKRAAMVAVALRTGILPLDNPADADVNGDLSAREIDILGRVADGETTSHIAEDLGISPRSVEIHLARIGEELGITDRAGMVAIALRTGLLPLDPTTAERAQTNADGELSTREIDVLGLVAEGKSNQEIHTELGVSPRTVTHILTSIGKKLNAVNRAAMVAVALRTGMLPLTAPATTSEPTPTAHDLDTHSAAPSAPETDQPRSPQSDRRGERPATQELQQPRSPEPDPGFVRYRQALTQAFVTSPGVTESDPVSQSLAQMTESQLRRAREPLNSTQRRLITEAVQAAHRGETIDIFQSAAVERLAKAVHAAALADGEAQPIPAPSEQNPSIAASESPRYGGLTDREVEVLDLVAADKTNQEIGALLGTSAATVKTQLSTIGGKLGTGDRAAMVAIALRTGILPLTAAVADPSTPTDDIQLSDREVEVLGLVAEGRTNREIGVEVGLSPAEVKGWLTRVGGKLGTSGRAGMVAIGLRRGFLPATVNEPAPAAGHGGLTDREVEVLGLIAEGKSNSDIGSDLGISTATVDSHLGRIARKLGNSDHAGMVAIALRTGILPMTVPDSPTSGSETTEPPDRTTTNRSSTRRTGGSGATGPLPGAVEPFHDVDPRAVLDLPPDPKQNRRFGRRPGPDPRVFHHHEDDPLGRPYGPGVPHRDDTDTAPTQRSSDAAASAAEADPGEAAQPTPPTAGSPPHGAPGDPANSPDTTPENATPVAEPDATSDPTRAALYSAVRNRQEVDWNTPVENSQILLIGEDHSNISGRVFLGRQAAALKAAGVTHFCIEASPHPAFDALNDGRSANLFNVEAGPAWGGSSGLVYAMVAAGITIVPFDVRSPGSKFGSPLRDIRESHMAKTIAGVAHENPDTKIAVLVGMDHLALDQEIWERKTGAFAVSMNARLRDAGYTTTSVSLWGGEMAQPGVINSIAEHLGVQDETFLADLRDFHATGGGFPDWESDFLLHLGSTDSFWLPGADRNIVGWGPLPGAPELAPYPPPSDLHGVTPEHRMPRPPFAHVVNHLHLTLARDGLILYDDALTALGDDLRTLTSDWTNDDHARSTVSLGAELISMYTNSTGSADITAMKTGEPGRRMMRVEVSAPDRESGAVLPEFLEMYLTGKLNLLTHRYGRAANGTTIWFEFDESGPDFGLPGLAAVHGVAIETDQGRPVADNLQREDNTTDDGMSATPGQQTNEVSTRSISVQQPEQGSVISRAQPAAPEPVVWPTPGQHATVPVANADIQHADTITEGGLRTVADETDSQQAGATTVTVPNWQPPADTASDSTGAESADAVLTPDPAATSTPHPATQARTPPAPARLPYRSQPRGRHLR
ncbi:LuxR C-terminal-related transcriptional regulator [Nocardia sp. Marseille-Q1738]